MSDSKVAHDATEIVALAKIIIDYLQGCHGDIGSKMAACKSAANIYENSIHAQGMAVVMNNVINGSNK